MQIIVSENSSLSKGTKALVPLVVSKSNPDLFEMWDSITTVKLNRGGVVDVPWAFVLGNSMNIPDDFRMDVKREDGWEMLYHTLIDEDLAEPNYILFYNRKTCVLKVFYFSIYPENNQHLYWVLEANSPSCVIPSNTITQKDEKRKLATTSNVIKHNSIGDIGHLNIGWNAFSFELPYGYSDNSDLVVSIYGYNEEVSESHLKGNFSGVVNIPKEVTEDSELLGSLGTFAKAASSILTGYSKLTGFISNEALQKITEKGAKNVSIASTFLKSLSSLFSKTKIVNIQGTMSGQIDLIGSSTIVKSGLVQSLDNVSLPFEKIGLWTMKTPTLYSYPFYVVKFPNRGSLFAGWDVYHKLSCDPDDESGFFESMSNKLNLNSYIVVNPALYDELESFEVISASVISIKGEASQYNSAAFPIPYVYIYNEGRDTLFTTNYEYKPELGVFVGNYLSKSESPANNLLVDRFYEYYRDKEHVSFNEFERYLTNHMFRQHEFMIVNSEPKLLPAPKFQKTAINVVVLFNYKDGHTFISSRTVPAVIEIGRGVREDELRKELMQTHSLFDPYHDEFEPEMALQDILYPNW